MIRVFKRIKEHNWKYTFGEVALIFIGITLAIWFNNWNQNRLDKIKQTQYLEELKNELQVDLNELYDLINANNDRMRRINLFNEVLNSPEPELNCDSIQKYIASASFINVFTGSSTVFEDLESTGNLRLIDNRDLKRRVMRYYSKVESRKKYEDLNSSFHINTIGPFLKEYWNTGALFRLGQNLKGLNKGVNNQDCENTVLKLKYFRTNDQLKQELLNQINFSYFIMNSNNGEYELMKEDIMQLFDFIDKEND